MAEGDPKRIAFFDRDGVLNEDHGYVHTIEKFVWIEGAMDALARFKKEGWWVVVVTNQSGIERDYYTEADFLMLSERMVDHTPIDLILYCPHLNDCPARKPGTGMIESALQILPGTLKGSFLVGDKGTDMLAAEAAGLVGLHFEESMGNLNEFLMANGY